MEALLSAEVIRSGMSVIFMSGAGVVRAVSVACDIQRLSEMIRYVHSVGVLSIESLRTKHHAEHSRFWDG